MIDKDTMMGWMNNGPDEAAELNIYCFEEQDVMYPVYSYYGDDEENDNTSRQEDQLREIFSYVDEDELDEIVAAHLDTDTRMMTITL